MSRGLIRTAALLFAVLVRAGFLSGQDLAPRAYVITPTGSHAVLISTSFNRGNVLVDPTVPIEDLEASIQVATLGYYQSFAFLGRSSNLTLMLPYGRGDFEAVVLGAFTQAYRSGLADARIRWSVNLQGGPAMSAREYMKWQEKRLIGASLTVSMPSSQYDPARLINVGTNRWGFKPEIAFSRKWGRWVGDGYTGVWFFTENNKFYPGANRRTAQPIGAVEGHLSYYVKPRLWASLDANFWMGNRSAVNGVEKQDQQRNSRIGTTLSIPVTRRHSAKVSYSQGAYVNVGGDYRIVTIAWQYSWLTPPK